MRAFCAEHQIAVEGWSPIAQGEVLDDPTINEIAERAGETPAQVVLRWHIERGDIIFPKSATASRIRENFDIFGFELSGERRRGDQRAEQGRADLPDPDTFAGDPRRGSDVPRGLTGLAPACGAIVAEGPPGRPLRI